MPRTDNSQTIRLEDYRPTPFVAQKVDMVFRLFSDRTEVETTTALERRKGTGAAEPLRLAGDEIAPARVEIDGARVPTDRLSVDDNGLTIAGLPESGPFRLTVATVLDPAANSKLMGLYRSNGIWCTQIPGSTRDPARGGRLG